ncbi:MAG TPA: 30S ribosomal protein S17 [Desulfurella acetivorans]|uniref:Small ribosomal subunit protein uS17 n=1 Tax=Desulfurella acetivorans TaxID=33002 RepID=A0A7C6EDE1_DESAE|nr:30S ribosomal protein S17 [Desulfurella acetivorans]
MSKFVGEGVVISDKMDKTRVVRVEEYKLHTKIKKYVKKTKKFKIHDEQNESKVGDVVQFISCRPISKEKSFRLLKIVQRYVGLGEEI